MGFVDFCLLALPCPPLARDGGNKAPASSRPDAAFSKQPARRPCGGRLL